MPQFRIRTIMLLIAVTAVWTAYFTGRKLIERDLVAIEAMHALAPDLLVRNQNEYACLKIDRTDGADHIREYQCYLPLGHKYKLNLLWSKDFSLYGSTLQPESIATIAEGKHQILLNESPDKLSISVDGLEVIDVNRKRQEPQIYSSTGVSGQFNSQWYPLDQVLTLIRSRESTDGRISKDPGPGIALWIEAK